MMNQGVPGDEPQPPLMMKAGLLGGGEHSLRATKLGLGGPCFAKL